MGIMFFVPFLVNDFLIPAVIYLGYMHYGTDDHTYSFIVSNVQMFSPFPAAFWIYLYLVNYIDVKGNEIFYVASRMKTGEVLFFYILYTVTNTVPFLWYAQMYPSLVWEWLHLVIIYFFMAAVAYFMCYLLRSIALAFIPVLCYTFLAVSGNSGPRPPFWSFYESSGMSPAMLGTKYIWFLLAGVLFLIAGSVLNKIYTDY